MAPMPTPARQVTGTHNLTAIKAVDVSQSALPEQVYQIPVTQDLQKADGTGTISVVVQTLQVTPRQLTQQIQMANDQISRAQDQVAKLQAQLDAINALTAAAVTPVTPVVVEE